MICFNKIDQYIFALYQNHILIAFVFLEDMNVSDLGYILCMHLLTAKVYDVIMTKEKKL